MITIKGKEIKPETVSMWVNIIGFFASIIFYLSVEHNIANPAVVAHNPMQDSLVSINARLTAEINRLQSVEKSLKADLQIKKEQAAQEQLQVNKIKQKIYLNVHSSWDNLSKS